MRAILTRLAIRTDIGLAVGETELAVSHGVLTPFGWAEVARERHPCRPDELATAIERALTSRLSRAGLAKARVSVGLPALRVLFATRPLPAPGRDVTPTAQVAEVLQAPSFNYDDMVFDLLRPRAKPRPLAGAVACRKKHLAPILSALEACGVRPARIEPTPCALLRLAARRLRPPGRARAYVRVLLGEGRGLAVLLEAPDLPLLWSEFPLEAGSEAEAIRAAIATLEVQGPHAGLEAKVGAVLVHGRPDLGPLAEAGGPSPGGLRVLRHDAPALDEEAAASGLAEGPPAGVEAFNLARQQSAPPSLVEVFPWGIASIQVAVLVCATLFLNHRLNDARAEARAAAADDARFAWAAKVAPEKLRAEKKAIEQEVDAVRAFLESRIAWSAFTRNLIGRVPPEMALTGLLGLSELGGGKGKPKRSLEFKLRAPAAKVGAVPEEVPALLRALREDPVLRREFPDIKLSNIQPGQGKPGEAAFSSFTVNCLPAARAEPPKAAPAPAAKK